MIKMRQIWSPVFVFHDNANAFEKNNFLGGEKKRIPNTKKSNYNVFSCATQTLGGIYINI